MKDIGGEVPSPIRKRALPAGIGRPGHAASCASAPLPLTVRSWTLAFYACRIQENTDRMPTARPQAARQRV